MCCVSNIHTCYCTPYRNFQPASEAQHRRCGLLKSLYDRYCSGPRDFFSDYRHRQPDMEFLLGPSRGLRQCYRGLPNRFPERLPAQSQRDEFTSQMSGQ